MFGTSDEQKMTFMERQKMNLVVNGYKSSTMFFKMFFDKWYRRERFNTIVEKIDNYQNINEFRTMILHNHVAMPLGPTRNLYIWKPSDFKDDLPEDAVGQTADAARDDNVLLERRYLNMYWHYFRVSMGV